MPFLVFSSVIVNTWCIGQLFVTILSTYFICKKSKSFAAIAGNFYIDVVAGGAVDWRVGDSSCTVTAVTQVRWQESRVGDDWDEGNSVVVRPTTWRSHCRWTSPVCKKRHPSCQLNAWCYTTVMSVWCNIVFYSFLILLNLYYMNAC